MELERKFGAKDDIKTRLWLAYAYFHNGDYPYFSVTLLSKAGKLYDELIKSSSYDKNIHTFKACCEFGMCNYKAAKEECNKAPDSDLKNRLMLHIAQKLSDEKTLMEYHERLRDSSIPDQMCLAALHYARGHYEEATEIYKKIQAENKELLALNVYMALCYYKLDYFDVCLDLLTQYMTMTEPSIIGANLRACTTFQLYNGKTAEDELRMLEKVPHSGDLFQDNDLLRHNLVVLRNGENAMQILPPLVDVISETKLNLVIYHLKNQDIEEAFNIMKDVEPTSPKEYILKAIVHAVVGQTAESKEHLKVAQQLFQLVGGSSSECDTIPGRQCMASCFFLLKQFDDVLVYLKSIKEFFLNDDDFNWNFGIALAATGDYHSAEESLQQIKNEAYKAEYTYTSWLCKCYVMNGKPSLAWDLYVNMESSAESLSILSMLANDCYRMGHFYYAVKAFDVLERLDPDPEFFEGKRGAAVGVFQMVIAGKEQKEKLAEVISLITTTNNPQVSTSIIID